MAVTELEGIGVVLSVLLFLLTLYRQTGAENLPRSTQVMIDLVAVGLLIGIVLLIGQLTGLL
jgi:hypothetical protein